MRARARTHARTHTEHILVTKDGDTGKWKQDQNNKQINKKRSNGGTGEFSEGWGRGASFFWNCLDLVYGSALDKRATSIRIADAKRELFFLYSSQDIQSRSVIPQNYRGIKLRSCLFVCLFVFYQKEKKTSELYWKRWEGVWNFEEKCVQSCNRHLTDTGKKFMLWRTEERYSEYGKNWELEEASPEAPSACMNMMGWTWQTLWWQWRGKYSRRRDAPNRAFFLSLVLNTSLIRYSRLPMMQRGNGRGKVNNSEARGMSCRDSRKENVFSLLTNLGKGCCCILLSLIRPEGKALSSQIAFCAHITRIAKVSVAWHSW